MHNLAHIKFDLEAEENIVESFNQERSRNRLYAQVKLSNIQGVEITYYFKKMSDMMYYISYLQFSYLFKTSMIQERPSESDYSSM